MPLVEAMHRAAAESLERTPELLPVLKDAGVVDAGGEGFVDLLEGILCPVYDVQIRADGKRIEADQHRRAVVRYWILLLDDLIVCLLEVVLGRRCVLFLEFIIQLEI